MQDWILSVPEGDYFLLGPLLLSQLTRSACAFAFNVVIDKAFIFPLISFP